MYALLRAIAGIALRWFYRGIDVEGLDRVPRGAPIILVVNHPNALVDALVVGWAIPRRVIITAKATLFQNPMFAWFLGRAGVVPLVRASDVRSGAVPGPSDASRNQRSFQALRSVLERGGAMLIFPEGISHDQPALAPLRTGAARIALQARDEAGVRELHIVPVGLTFERKDAPRSRVLAQVGEPIAMDDWQAPAGVATSVQALTDEIDARLRAVTLNYASIDDASRSAALASLFASVLADEPRALGATPPLGFEVGLARRVDDARALLAQRADDALRARADALLKRLAEFEQALSRHGVALDDVTISTSIGDGARFLAREGWIIAVGGPVAFWGFVNHWIPFHAARAIAVRSIESAADPAMRTIVAGAALVLAFYAAQGAVVAALAGKLAAILYLVSLPLAADVNFALRERLSRGTRRARAYVLFRQRPRLQARLREELRHLRAEAFELDRLLREEGRAQQPV
jgi:1-acyl-sn-glycerol-3-phosphate acyltransferase